jgi:hypothetical protein
MTSFRIGQKVVCIYEGPWYFTVTGQSGYVHYDRPCPIFKAIYTISGFDIYDGILLREIDHEMTYADGSPCGWRYDCFRPVNERKTDISIFTKMLTPKKVRA